MSLNPHIQNILKNSKKDTEWKKEAEERKSVRQESLKSGIIATQLAYYMKVNGISQTDLGNRIGVSPQQISKILKGRENLTLGTIEKIETALQIELVTPVALEVKRNKSESIESRTMHLDLGDQSIGYQIHDTANSIERKVVFYGGSIRVGRPIASLPNEYSEQIKVMTIETAHHLMSLTVGTARGILHSETKNTDFNRLILPSINLTKVIDADIVQPFDKENN